jgi:hypothetical protein
MAPLWMLLAVLPVCQQSSVRPERIARNAVAMDPANSRHLRQLQKQCRQRQDASCVSFAERGLTNLEKNSSRKRGDIHVEISPTPSFLIEGPPEERRWGRYQFPTMYRTADGRLIAFVHVEADSATAYGSPKRTFISGDEGRTWAEQEPSIAARLAYGFRLTNGDWLRIDTPPSLDASTIQLPPKTGAVTIYKAEHTLYPMRGLASDLRLIFFQRFLSAGGREWQSETSELNDPDGMRYSVEGRFPRIWWGDLRAHPSDRSLFAVTYPSIPAEPPHAFGSACFRSTDNGRTWELRGRVPHLMDPVADPKANLRAGFSEPAFEILPDGSLYAVLRTTDGHGIGPMYDTRSRDHGVTWTRPRPFAPNGVMPRLLRLDNGVLVLSSGRPGVQLRFSASGNGDDWSQPWDLLPYDPDRVQADTCGYTDMVATGRDTFVIVYSWFQKPGGPNGSGPPRKAVLARRIRVSKSGS